MKFSQYPIAAVLKENLEQLGFKKPTDIQYKSIASILKGEDVLAIAQTGTGKTAAFAIPVIHQIHERAEQRRTKSPKAIVMVPTHELALQIEAFCLELTKNTLVSILALYGGVDQSPQIKRLKEGVDLVIATPGRLFDLVSQGHLDLTQVRTLILDEADHMLDLGFYKDIRDLMFKLPKKRQTLFFSATIDKKIKDLAYSIVNNPIRIQVSPKNPVNKNITHSVAFIEMDDKRFFLERVANENPESKVLVFVRTKVRAERVANAMARAEIKAETIHSDKDQEHRNRVMNDFKTGELKMLIATDITARGIDIPNVDYVVNYDLPDIPENYVHRIGRTGRGREKGTAVSFCASTEIAYLKAIEKYIHTEIDVIKIDEAVYQNTIDFTAAPKQYDWESLINEAEELKDKAKKKKGRKKNQKRNKK